MGRRRRGLQHMIATTDEILESCRPKTLTRRQYLQDCERAVNTSELQSDEWSTEDEDLANNESKRPDRLKDSNSVIKVKAKIWRSTRVSKNHRVNLNINL
jgi:hypothetical protein